MRPLLIALTLLPLFLGTAPSAADDPAQAGAEPVGRVVAVEGKVHATLGTDTRRVERGEAVFRGDWVETDAKARAKIVLDDETELVIGPGSRIHLDEFVYEAGVDSGKVLLEMSVGLLRFTSGVLESESYEVTTPVASIGIRGTIFDVIVSAIDFATTVILREGRISISSLVKATTVGQKGHASTVPRANEEPSEPHEATKQEEDATEPLKKPFRSERQTGRHRPNLPSAVTKPNLPPTPDIHMPSPPTHVPQPPPRPGRY